MSHAEEVRMDKLSEPVRTEGSGEQMSESLVDKWRKIPLGAGAVVAGMCADELAEELGALVQRLRMFAERSENADWSDGINRAADELTEWLAARGIGAKQ